MKQYMTKEIAVEKNRELIQKVYEELSEIPNKV